MHTQSNQGRADSTNRAVRCLVLVHGVVEQGGVSAHEIEVLDRLAAERSLLALSLRYAVELRHLDSAPMDRMNWTAPKNTDEIDRQVVANPK